MQIAMIDLLAQTPFYDRALAEALVPMVDRLTLYTTRFHYEPDYFKSAEYVGSRGLLDLSGTMLRRGHLLRRTVRLLEYLLNWQILLRRFQSSPPDVVHIQWVHLLRAPRLLSEIHHIEHLCALNIPVIYTMHNFLPHDSNCEIGAIYQQLYRSVSYLIVHTRTDQQRALTMGMSDRKIALIPHGPLFADQFGLTWTQARERLQISSNTVMLLMLGVVRPYKGVEETLYALAQLVEEYPEICLWVAGNALNKTYAQHLQQLSVKLGLQHHVRWQLSYVPSVAIGQFHAAADVVLFPYRNISQSGAFLTAAALGKCTLSTRAGGLAEIIRDGENGIQIAAAEPGTIAEGIRRCLALSAEQRESIGLQLRDEINHLYSWEHIAQETASLYAKARG